MIVYSSLVYFFGWVVATCLGDGLADDIYVEIPIEEGAAGYRLFNGTHQFGFHTEKSDFSGVVVFMNNTDVNKLRNCWRQRFRDYYGKYHVVITTDMISRDLVKVFLRSKCIAGLIVIDPVLDIDPEQPLSHDGACPNPNSGIYARSCTDENAWNEMGYILRESLLSVNWNMQILYLNNRTSIELIKKCHDLFNILHDGSSSVTFPLCAASFGTFSSGAGSTSICLKRSGTLIQQVDQAFWNSDVLCDVLEGVNIIAYLPPKIYEGPSPTQNDSYLMFAARMDSFGLIPEISPGEVSVVTSAIAVMAAAHVIGAHMNDFESAANSSNRRLIIAFFDGEAFDYIGSSSAAYSMSRGDFPIHKNDDTMPHLETITVSQLEGIIEVQHLGVGDGTVLNALADGKQYASGDLTDLLTSLYEGVRASGGSLQYRRSSSRLPPSSWYSFSRLSPSIKGVVLAPFSEKYEYRRINSMLDRVDWTDDRRSAAISQIILAASALIRVAADYVGVDNSAKEILEVDSDFVSTLFDCFLNSSRWMTCDFFNKTGFMTMEKSTYVTARRSNVLSPYIFYLLNYATGSTSYTENITDERTCVKRDHEQQVYSFTWQADPYTGVLNCYRSPVVTYDVISPAFRIEGYDYSNTTYSTWSESRYDIEPLRLYLLEDESYEKTLFLIGLVFAIVSFLIVGRCTEDSFRVKKRESGEEVEDMIRTKDQ